MERRNDAPPDDLPVVLATQGTHGPVVHATNRAARMAGVSAGGRVVDMRSVCPELRVEYADIAGDIAALDRLVIWARRWCPWSIRDGNALILDTTGSDHLSGGETAMLVDMETRLSLIGLTSRLSVAPTWGAAWALSRYGRVRQIVTPQSLEPDLAPLPVEALRLNGETVLLLKRLGLKTIGALAGIPRMSLTKRFAKAPLISNPVMRLDQAMGRLAEPVSSKEVLARFEAQTRLAEPIQDPTPYLPQLCDDLCRQLTKQGHGCRRLRIRVYRSDGEISDVVVTTARPNRDPDHLRRLFDDKLERINPGFGFDLITLTADVVEPLIETQTRLEGGSDNELDLSHLIDRLSARFGERTLSRPALYPSHLPERAEVNIRPGSQGVGTQGVAVQERPVRLFDVPEEVRVLYAVPEGPPSQFIWRRQTLRVVRYAGPERIAPEWWRDRPGSRLRDYFRIEDDRGRRIWIYREGLHEDGRGGDPRWFVHGMFA